MIIRTFGDYRRKTAIPIKPPRSTPPTRRRERKNKPTE
jgi:hypothetical protein